MKQQEEEYNYGWKVIEAEFHRRADELFDFQFRRRLEFGTDVADEYKYTSTNKNHKKKETMKKWTLIALIGAAIVLIALSLISKTIGYVIVAAMAAVFVAYGLLWAYTKYWPRSSK